MQSQSLQIHVNINTSCLAGLRKQALGNWSTGLHNHIKPQIINSNAQVERRFSELKDLIKGHILQLTKVLNWRQEALEDPFLDLKDLTKKVYCKIIEIIPIP